METVSMLFLTNAGGGNQKPGLQVKVRWTVFVEVSKVHAFHNVRHHTTIAAVGHLDQNQMYILALCPRSLDYVYFWPLVPLPTYLKTDMQRQALNRQCGSRALRLTKLTRNALVWQATTTIQSITTCQPLQIIPLKNKHTTWK